MHLKSSTLHNTDHRPTLSARLGLPTPDLDALNAALVGTSERTVAWLVAAGLAAPDAEHAPLARLAMPKSVAELVGVAIAAAEAAGDDDHAEALRLHYLDALPSARVAQLLGTSGAAARLFHTPSPWARLPRFRRGVETLLTCLTTHKLDPEAAIGLASFTALGARFPTIADWYVTTYWGRLEPMFQALPHDLAAALPADADDATFWAAVDHRLSLPMLHELLHFGPERDALFPPYLDEALAGHFGVVIDAGTAFPAGDADNALFGWPWFTQVGEALCRAFGEGPVLGAHAGLMPWSKALPEALLSAFDRLFWDAYRAAPAVHFHPDTTRPDRWVKLIYAAAAGHDVAAFGVPDIDALPWHAVELPPCPDVDIAIANHALLAMGLATSEHGGSLRVRRNTAPVGVRVDGDGGFIEVVPTDDVACPMRYALPPLGQRGVRLCDIHDLTINDLLRGPNTRLA